MDEEINIKLTQAQTNMIMIALERMDDSPGWQCEAANELWGELFDAGRAAGFGDEVIGAYQA